MLQGLAVAFLGLIVTIGQNPKSAERMSKEQLGEACRPAALRDFCRVGCADPPPIQTRRVEPDLNRVRPPLPRGAAILEVGIDLDGMVVSVCVVRGLREDFDKAAQAAARQSEWKVGPLKGKQRGFVLYLSVCTPETKCKPAPPEGADR